MRQINSSFYISLKTLLIHCFFLISSRYFLIFLLNHYLAVYLSHPPPLLRACSLLFSFSFFSSSFSLSLAHSFTLSHFIISLSLSYTYISLSLSHSLFLLICTHISLSLTRFICLSLSFSLSLHLSFCLALSVSHSDPNASLVFLSDAELQESKTFRLKKEASVGTVWSR